MVDKIFKGSSVGRGLRIMKSLLTIPDVSEIRNLTAKNSTTQRQLLLIY
jgi:hypothetical protein